MSNLALKLETNFNRVNREESIVATLPSVSSIFQATQENTLVNEAAYLETKTSSIIIESDSDYTTAVTFGRELKNMASKIVSYFKPMKESANKLHKEICGREKLALTPVNNAESILKRTMSSYILRKEEQRAALEEKARKEAEKEAELKLSEAIKHEETGNEAAAISALQDAQLADSMSRTMTVLSDTPNIKGVTVSKDWEIVSISPSDVPIDINGIEIRPVDEKAIMRLIRQSKGKIKIPGIEYREHVKTSIRKDKEAL